MGKVFVIIIVMQVVVEFGKSSMMFNVIFVSLEMGINILSVGVFGVIINGFMIWVG